MYHIPLTVQCIYGCSDEGGDDGNEKEGSELPGGLVLWGELEEELRLTVLDEREVEIMVRHRLSEKTKMMAGVLKYMGKRRRRRTAIDAGKGMIDGESCIFLSLYSGGVA